MLKVNKKIMLLAITVIGFAALLGLGLFYKKQQGVTVKPVAVQ